MAQFWSPAASGARCLYFWFYMVGSQQANISVYIAEGDAITEDPKWSLTQESPVWNLGYLEIPDRANYKVVIAKVKAPILGWDFFRHFPDIF